MPTSSLLVRWQRGWTERTSPGAIASWGRREALLTIGAIATRPEADRIADRQLEIFANVREQITTDIMPRNDAETPMIAFLPGDIITVPNRVGALVQERVVSVTVAEDDDGYITYAPEFHDIIYEQDVAFEDWLKKMANGTMGSAAKVGSPSIT